MNNIIFEYKELVVTKYNVSYVPKRGDKVFVFNRELIVSDYIYDVEEGRYKVTLDNQCYII